MATRCSLDRHHRYRKHAGAVCRKRRAAQTDRSAPTHRGDGSTAARTRQAIRALHQKISWEGVRETYAGEWSCARICDRERQRRSLPHRDRPRGEDFVMVGGVTTVVTLRVAVPGFPVVDVIRLPPLIPLPVVLTSAPVIVPVTFTLKVHVSPALPAGARVTPVPSPSGPIGWPPNTMLFEPGVA